MGSIKKMGSPMVGFYHHRILRHVDLREVKISKCKTLTEAGQFAVIRTPIVKLLEIRKVAQHRHPIAMRIRTTARVLREPEDSQAGQLLQVEQLKEACNIVPPEIKLR